MDSGNDTLRNLKATRVPIFRRRRVSTPKRIKVLLVDDHALTLEALKHYFSRRSRFAVSSMVLDGAPTLEKLRSAPPDVVIMNMHMAQLDGARATQLFLRTFPKTKVIGFSGFEERTAVLSAIRAGARGYLLKARSSRELFQAVDQVNRGEVFFSPSISKMIEDDYFQNLAQPSEPAAGALTAGERKILARVADGLSNKETAAALGISVRTVEKYRESLMAKLKIRSVAGLTKFAIRAGLSSLE